MIFFQKTLDLPSGGRSIFYLSAGYCRQYSEEFMKINQVEELVGITKKNIRFYEDQGLITPERNPENSYREYNLKDVDRLLKIKLLRKLDVPIEDIRMLLSGEMTLGECVERQGVYINRERHRLKNTEELLEKIHEGSMDFSGINASEYLSEMKKLEEGGVEFMNITDKDINNRKKMGSYIAAAVMITLFLAMILVMAYAHFSDGAPLGLFIVFAFVFLFAIGGVVIALRQRIKEINGGEENEARKY